MNNFPVSVHTDSENIKFTNDQEVAVLGLIEFIAAPWSDKNYICRAAAYTVSGLIEEPD